MGPMTKSVYPLQPVAASAGWTVIFNNPFFPHIMNFKSIQVVYISQVYIHNLSAVKAPITEGLFVCFTMLPNSDTEIPQKTR